jgi:hypothetical protein
MKLCSFIHFLIWLVNRLYAVIDETAAGNGWTFSRGLSQLIGLFGYGPSGSGYGTAGYVINLPLNRTEALATMAALKSNVWVDRGTQLY